VTVKKKVTFLLNNSTLTSGTNKTRQADGVTVTFSNIHRTDANYIRPSNRSTITVSANDGPFTSVTINFSSNYYTYDFTTNSGSHSLSGTTWTWTGSTNNLVITNNNDNTHRLTTIVIEY
jgi:hypothetical protein